MLFKRFSIIVFSLFLVFEPVFLQANQIVVDTSVNSKYKPSLYKAGNGTTIINITNPNNSGLSHNKFSEYSISKQNAILNNSKKIINTQLAGIIEKNPNLVKSASTILNEITGTSRTNLEGYTEVAGQKANVIIANPNGIYVKGGGFINVPQATLTTGRPVFDNEILKSFNVQQGIVQFDKEDFNASNINQVDIYAKAIKLNAKIHAKDLNVIAGTNNIKTSPLGVYQGFTKTNSDKKEEFALSSSLFGGIYGNKITFIGTQDGVGVNLPIEVTAQDNLSFDINGDIVLKKAISNGTLDVKANDVKIDKSYSNKVVINSNNLEVESLLGASEKLDIQSNSLLNKGIIANGVNADFSIHNKKSQILEIKANQVTNEGELFSKNNLDITGVANSVFTNQGKISSSSSILIDMKQITNNGLFASLGNINLTGLTFNAKNDSIQANNMYFNFINSMDLNNSDYKSKGDLLVNQGLSSNVNIQNDNGILQADKRLEINANELNGNTSELTANSILLNSNSLNLKSGKIKSTDEIKIDSIESANLSGTNISANNDIKVKAKDINIDNATIFSVDKSLNINAEKISAKEGLYEAKEDIGFKSKEDIDLNKSNLTALGNIKLETEEDVIISKDDSQIRYKDGKREYFSKVQAGNNLTIKGKNVFNKNSLLNSNETISLQAKNTIDNKNGVLTGKDIFINQGLSSNVNIQNDNGILQADKRLEINANELNGNTSELTANSILLNSNSLNLKSGKIKSTDEIKIDSIESANLSGTNISANNDIKVKAKDINIDNATIFSVDKSLNINAEKISAKEGLYEAKEDIGFKSKEDIDLNKSNLTALGNIKLETEEDVIISKDDSQIRYKDGKREYFSKVQAGNNLTIKGKNVFNKNSLLNSNETISLQAKNTIDNENGVLTGKDIFINQGLSSNVNIQNDNGILQADKRLEINANELNGNTSELTANSILLNSNSLNLKSGKIKSTDEIKIDSIESANLSGTNISANNDIKVKAKDINIDNATIFSVDKSLNINAEKISAKEGLYEAKEDIGFKSKEDIDLNKSNLTALGNIKLETEEDVIISKDDSQIRYKDGKREYFSKVQAGNNLTIKGKNVFNKNSLLNSNETISLQAKNTIDNKNGVLTGKDIFINKDELSGIRLETKNGFIQGSNKVQINTDSINGENIELIGNNLLINTLSNLDLDKNSKIRAIGLLDIKSNNLNNYGYLLGNNILINTNDITNYGGIGAKDILTINSTNFTNYNTVFSNNNINLYVKNSLLNKTDKSILEDIDNSLIYARNNINIQGNENKTKRVNTLTNHNGTIQTQNGNINVYVNSFDNKNDDATIEKTTNSNTSFKLYNKTDGFFPDKYYGNIFFNQIDYAGSYSYMHGNHTAYKIRLSLIGLNEIEKKIRDKYLNLYFSKKVDTNSNILHNDSSVFGLYQTYGKAIIDRNEYTDSNQFFYRQYDVYKNEGDSTFHNVITEVYYIPKHLNAAKLMQQYNQEVYEALKNKYAQYGLHIIKIGNNNSWLTINEKNLHNTLKRGAKFKNKSGYWKSKGSDVQSYAIALTNIPNKRNLDTIYHSHNSFSPPKNYYNYSKKGFKSSFTKKPENKQGSQVLSGNDINIDSNNFTNHISTVSAKNNIDLKNSNVKNQSFSSWDSEEILITNNKGVKLSKYSKDGVSTPIETYSAIIEAGNNITGNIKSFENDELSNNDINIKDKQNIQGKDFSNSISKDLEKNQNLSKSSISKINNKEFSIEDKKNNILKANNNQIENNQNSLTIDTKNEKISLENKQNTLNIELPKNKFGLFITNTNPEHKYLIETNPIYTSIKGYYSSDYFLNKINYNPNEHIKKLGDAVYETKLIKEAILEHTSRQYALSNESINIQYKVMMDNAINQASILNLEIGKTPTKQQLASLTEDIVWLEIKTVNGVDVLVPVTYFAKDYNKEQGALVVANNNIELNIKDDFKNTGVIQSNNLNIKSNSITNKTGTIISNNVAQLTSNNDIKNTNGASIKAGSLSLTSKEGSIINDTYTKRNELKLENSKTVYTTIGQKSSIESTKGNLILRVKNDINNNAGDIKSAKSLGLYTEDGNINITTKENDSSHYWRSGKNFDKFRTLRHVQSNIEAKEDIVLNSGKAINLEALDLKTNDDIHMSADDNINILAVNNIDYKDKQRHTKKSFGRSSTKRKMTHKETVVSSNLEGKNILLDSKKDINLESVNINAKEDKIARAGGTLNILAKTYKEGIINHTSKSSWGGMVKSEYKYEKDHLKIKSSELTSKNMILDANEINVQASKIKAEQAEITTGILNMFSSKESLYENEFSIDGGVLTATIENKGKIEELVIPSTIEVNNQLIFNKEDITAQLETDNLIKVLSSQGELTNEQINLIKEVANNKEWHTKTTTLSGIGALIVQVVVTYFTAGAGTGLVAGISNAALKAATQAAIQSVVTQATTSLVTAAITGNKPQLNLKSMVKGVVTAGVLSYATNAIGLEMGYKEVAETKDGVSYIKQVDNLGLTDKITQASIESTLKAGANSLAYGSDFKDGLVSNLTTSGTNLLAKEAFSIVGHELYTEDSEYKDILPPKTITHAVIGGSLAKLRGGDFTSGAISTATAHLTAEIMIDNYMDDVVSGKMTENELLSKTKALSALTSGVISKVAKPNQSDKDLNISNEIGQSNVDNNSLKLITTAIKIARKLKKIEDKITRDKLKDIGLDEIADILEDGSTLLDPEASIAEKAMAAADLLVGTEFNNKKTKVVSKVDNKLNVIKKHDDVISYKINDKLTPILGTRNSAINRAWKLEQELVIKTGKGTRNWTKLEIEELIKTGKIKGYTGHHRNNVAQFPEWKGDPRNIDFLSTTPRGGEHLNSLQGHRGNYQNSTSGRLIDRKKMIKRLSNE